MSNKTMHDEPFHLYKDTKETKKTKHFIIQEREVSYRFYPHFHPYMKQLMQRLLQKSTAGLQAADTEYEPNNASLPGSVEVAIGQNSCLSIPGGSYIALLADLQATLPEGVPIVLSANMQFKVSNKALIKIPDGLSATLIEGMSGTPVAGTKFNLLKKMSAIVGIDTKIYFTANTQITLHDGTQATIEVPMGSHVATPVLLLRGTQLNIPKGTQVTLLRSQLRPVLYGDIFSPTRYKPSDLVQRPHPVKDLDFTFSGAYSIYNWELFFHVPITIAIHLSKNQRFAEAQRWFHYLFDPTDDSDGPTPERFWKVRPFQYTDVKKMEELMVNLATGTDPTLRNETIRSIEAWKDAPFRPHVIARYRQQAYMYKTVMAYLDNLVAWGDSLFRQDTGEAIDEAMMIYMLAATILGPRPLPVPKKGSVRPQTYANLRSDLDKFGNAMRDMEADIPFDLMPFPTEDAGDNDHLATIRSLGKALYFCVPRNDKMLSYWDTVADRLFKIRNSRNIHGTVRQLALFEPPIDPAMLARAAAAGLEVSAIISGANQPLPLVRFQLLVQKAAEICQEVKSLGGNILSAMEKEDNEALAILRAKHERTIMGLAESVKYGQWQETIKACEGLEKSLLNSIQRYIYYERLLGEQESDIKVPELDALNTKALKKMEFKAGEPEVRVRGIEVDIAQGVEGISGGKMISSHEKEEIDKLSDAQIAQHVAVGLDTAAAIWRLMPKIGIDVMPFGVGGDVVFGGEDIAESLRIAADISRGIAGRFSYEANNAAKIGSYARREQEWSFQSNLAAGEITQIFKQLRAAQIREAITKWECNNHQTQIRNADEIEYFLTGELKGDRKKPDADWNKKYTNQSFYTWMRREVKGLYAQCFQFAFDIARKAERALQHELGNPELSYLEFGYLAGKEGLLAGEKLYLDIKRMEMAYHDLNQREYELTKHVSLLQVDPLALLQLRTTGQCAVRLPEELFDMDGPGHYFRRIKTVALSIPCVTGPYASVNCTLTMLKSSIRKTQVLRDGIYAREDAEDDRFNDYFGSLQSIVTSSAQNDSGLFETSLHDERYLPFENSGVVSEWRLELPADVRQFDYATISDVILHLRYTAREGGGLLKNGAVSNLMTRIEEAQAAGSVRLFSVRHEFPTEWAKFKSATVDLSEETKILAGLTLNLRDEHYPFWSKDKDDKPIVLKQVDIFAKPTKGTETPIEVFDNPNAEGNSDSLVKDAYLNDARVGKLTNIQLPAATGEFTLYFTDKSMKDLWLALTWGK